MFYMIYDSYDRCFDSDYRGNYNRGYNIRYARGSNISCDIGYHIGKRPLHPKWKPTPFNNLWRNSNVSDDITPSQSN